MSPTRSARLRAMPVRRRGLRDDTGASLLLAMFAVLFVSIVVSVMVTGLDGGIRQNTQVALTQNDRIATSGALQAAIALTSRSSYAVGSLACPIGNGFTYSDPTFGSVRITCKSVKEDALSASGDSNLDLGDDAVVLTDQGPDGKGGWVENNPGWVYVAGSVRVAAPSSSTSSVLANGLTGNACATLQTDPNASSQKACGQILVGGYVWAGGKCSPGVYPVTVSGTSLTNVPGQLQCQNANASSYVSTIVAKAVNTTSPALSELPMPSTSRVTDQSATVPTCYPNAGPTEASSPAMAVFPAGYYGDLTSSSPLSVAVAGGYYVPDGTTSAGAPCSTTRTRLPATIVDLQPGNYFLRLAQQLVVASGQTLVGGTPVVVDAPSPSRSAYVTCSQASPGTNGVQLLFGAASAHATSVSGLVAGASSSNGVVSLCGRANPGSSAGGPTTVAIRGLTSAQLGGASSLSVAGSSLYPDPVCNVTQNGGASLSTTSCSLVQTDSSGSGSLNVHGFVFAPNDGIELYTSPSCSAATTLWQALDCEFDPRAYSLSGNGGEVSFDSGIVANALYTQPVSIAGTLGAIQGDGSTWTATYWLPTISVPGATRIGDLDVVFQASGVDSTTGAAFTGTAEAKFSNLNAGATKWQNVSTVAWNNW